MVTIENEDPNQIAFSVKGAPGQLPALMDLQDSNGISKFMVDKDGNYFSAPVQPFKYTSFYASLQQAVDSLPTDPATGGGAIFHPRGTMFETGGTIIPSHVTVLGENRDTSIFDYENCTAVPVCPECDEEMPVIAIRCTFNDTDGGGGAVIESGMRDLHIRAKVSETLLKGIGTHWLKTPGQPEVDTLSGGWRVQLENLDICNFRNNICFSPGGVYGLLGLSSFKHLKLKNSYEQSLLMLGDNRSNLYEDVHVVGIRSAWYGCALLQAHYASAVIKSVFEAGSGTGLEISSWRGGVVHGNYFESVMTGLSLTNTTNAVDVCGTFMYGMGDSGFFVDTSTNNSIHHTLIQYGSPKTCGWSNQIGGNRFYACQHDLYEGDPYHYFAPSVTGIPAYIEDPATGQIQSGQVNYGSGLGADGLGNAQLVLRVKTTTGAPTDALYGALVGTLVYNSFDKVMYVHGPDGANDWDVI